MPSTVIENSFCSLLAEEDEELLSARATASSAESSIASSASASDSMSSVSDATAMPYSPVILSVPVTMALVMSPSSAAIRSVSFNMES